VTTPAPTTVVLYDGVCGLCNRLNQFLLPRDERARLRFAALQSPAARRLLARHGLDPSDLDTVYVIADWGTATERALARSRAVLHAVGQLDGWWRVLAILGRLVPAPIADLAYRVVARNRYRIFGRYDRCMLPPANWQERYLDQ
jgi:predicted DCC family thiol-disulfide oxidoreductase YuxK